MVYILTKAGKHKVREISNKYSLSQIGEKADLHRTTVGKIILGNEGVSLKSIERFSANLGLDLKKNIDYELLINHTHHETQKSQLEKPQKTEHSPNYDVPKYVKRQFIEQQVYKSMMLTNCTVRIKACKNMGKTTLITQVLERLKTNKNYRTVFISLREADNSNLSDLNELLRWLYTNVSDKLNIKDDLGLPYKLNEWDDSTKIFGSKMTCTKYFEEYLLQKLETPMVLCLDNLELLFINENTCQDLLAMLRSWDDKGSRNFLWKKLRLVICYAPNIEMKMNLYQSPVNTGRAIAPNMETKMNPNQSPFNIGTAIELPEFTPKQVQQFAEVHQINWNDSQVRELMNIVGGHPYLVKLTIDSLKTCNDVTLEQILETAPTKDGIYHSPHLQEHLAIFKKDSDLAEVFLSIIKGSYLANIETINIKILINLGLVKYQDGQILVRCQLYRLYFETYLGDVG